MNETTNLARQKRFKQFVGIDVSKNKLDFAVYFGKRFIFHREITNHPEAIGSFLKELRAIPDFKGPQALFCMEDTGVYANHAINALKKKRLNFVVENAVRIQNSLGLLRGKNDKIDAMRIAQFIIKNKDDVSFWKPERPVMVQLKMLDTTRERLLNVRTILTKALDEQESFIDKRLHKIASKSCQESIAAVTENLKDIERCIDSLIAMDPILAELMSYITSVPAIGRVTARQIILCTNEFQDINDPKKFACYAGVAPFKKESGKMIRNGRVSKLANKKMKSLLHMCAMVSLQKGGELKEYFDRKKNVDGKAGMLVMNAIRNKLILRIFACVKQQRHYSKIWEVKPSNGCARDETKLAT